jgi:hypothetical protein
VESTVRDPGASDRRCSHSREADLTCARPIFSRQPAHCRTINAAFVEPEVNNQPPETTQAGNTKSYREAPITEFREIADLPAEGCGEKNPADK